MPSSLAFAISRFEARARRARFSSRASRPVAGAGASASRRSARSRRARRASAADEPAPEVLAGRSAGRSASSPARPARPAFRNPRTSSLGAPICASAASSWRAAARAAATRAAASCAAVSGISPECFVAVARFGFRFFSAAAEGTNASSAALVRRFSRRLARFKRSRSGSSSRFRRFFDSDLRSRLRFFSFSRLRFFPRLSWLDDEEEESEEEDDEAARPMASRTGGRNPTQRTRATRRRAQRSPDAMAGSRSSTQGRAVRSARRRVFFRHTKVTTPASSFSRAFAVVGVWRSTADRHRMGALARRPALVAVCALLLLCPAPAEGACALPSPKRRSDPRWAPSSSRAHHD